MNKKQSKEHDEELSIDSEELTITEKVRKAINSSKYSYYQIGKMTGTNDRVVSAFAKGKTDTRTSTLDAIVKGLKLIVDIRLREEDEANDD